MPIKQKGGQKRGLFLVVIGSLITIMFSSMLIHGVRKVWIDNVWGAFSPDNIPCGNCPSYENPRNFQSQSAWFLPWLAQQSAELMFGVGFFIAYSLTGVNFSVQQGVTESKAFRKEYLYLIRIYGRNCK